MSDPIRKDDIQGDINNNVLVNSKDGRIQTGKIYAYIANGLFGLAGVAAIFGVEQLRSTVRAQRSVRRDGRIGCRRHRVSRTVRASLLQSRP